MNNDPWANAPPRRPAAEMPEVMANVIPDFLEHLVTNGASPALREVVTMQTLSITDVLDLLRGFFLDSYPHLLHPKYSKPAQVDKICGRVLLCMRAIRKRYVEALQEGSITNTHPTFGLIMVDRKDLSKVAKGPKSSGSEVPQLTARITDTAHTSTVLPTSHSEAALLLWQHKGTFLTKFEVNDVSEPMHNPSRWIVCSLNEELFCGEHRTVAALNQWVAEQVIREPAAAEESRVVMMDMQSLSNNIRHSTAASSQPNLSAADVLLLEFENMRVSEGRCCECGAALPEKKRQKCCGCRRAQYCDKACQRKDWKKHKVLCRAAT